MTEPAIPVVSELKPLEVQENTRPFSRWPWVGLAVIVFLGLLIRCHELGTVHSWFDESLGWRMSQFSPGEIVARSERNVHPPFHFLLLSVWRKLFGGSLLTLRSYSVLWGLGTIVGGYLLARAALSGSGEKTNVRPHGEIAGLLAATFIALSPLQIHWSQEIKMYALGTCLTVWSSWALLRWFQTGKWGWLLGYVPLAAGLALQHHYGTFTVFAQLTFALIWAARRGWSGAWQTEFVPVILASWATASLWALWLPSFLHQRALVKESYWIGRFQWNDVIKVWRDLFLTDTSFKRTETLSWVFAELVLAAVLLLLIHRQPGARLVGWLVLIPYALAVIWSVVAENVFIARFLIYAHVCLLVGIGILIASLPFRVLRFGMASLAIGMIGWTTLEESHHRTRRAQVPGMSAAVTFLKEAKAEEDLVLVCNPMLYLNVCVHNKGLSNVYAFDPGRGFPHFQGTPVMKDEDYFRPEQLKDSGKEWVWTIDAEKWLGGTWNVPLPSEWKLQEEKKIREWYGTLVLRSYFRETAPERPSSAMAGR